MHSILIVDKSGTIKEQKLKTIVEEELYLKDGYKSNTDFKEHTIWDTDIDGKKYSIAVYGKTSGRAGSENKYEFPPPIDNTLFFGKCILINKSESKSLSSKEWDSIYEKLYGGFEDIGEEDEEDEEDEDEDEDAAIKRTKEGYVKDDFIVDDDEDEDEGEDDDDEDEDEDEDDEDEDEQVFKKKKPVVKKPTVKKTAKQIKTEFEEKIAEEEDNYLDCTSELSEESYIE